MRLIRHFLSTPAYKQGTLMDSNIAKMISTAHNSLKLAYAPYSRFQVACCIQTKNNKLFVGVNVENGSYGLTLCAETSAIATMVSEGEQEIDSIVVLASSNKLCAPCGACRQRIHEFANENTLIHLCTHESVLQTMTINELLPLAFDFDFK